jgi:uncharacterized protein (TIGR02996 family)
VNEREALFQEILAARQDDAPRLVYADWLADQGEFEQAELMRAQIEAARRHPNGRTARVAALLRRHKDRIGGRLVEARAAASARAAPTPPVDWEIRRGLVDEVRLLFPAVLHFEQHLELDLPALLGEHPLLALRLVVPDSCDDLMIRLARQPWLEHLLQLTAQRFPSASGEDGEEESPSGLELLLRGPWRSLRELQITYLGAEAARQQREIERDLALLAQLRLPALQRLELSSHLADAMRDLALPAALEGVELRMWLLAR